MTLYSLLAGETPPFKLVKEWMVANLDYISGRRLERMTFIPVSQFLKEYGPNGNLKKDFCSLSDSAYSVLEDKFNSEMLFLSLGKVEFMLK